MEHWITVFGSMEKMQSFLCGIAICLLIELWSYIANALGDWLASLVRRFLIREKPASDQEDK